MSRGPGKWQRLILAAIESDGWVYLRTLLPQSSVRSDIVAVNRAAWVLVESGKIAIVRHGMRRGSEFDLAIGPPVASVSSFPGWDVVLRHPNYDIG